MLRVVIYRPPEFDKDFMHEFYDFIEGIMLNYDHVLIYGDFNVHLCCETKPMAKDFLNLINSSNLI